MIDHVLVLGGGSAGFLAALTLKVKIPSLRVTVIRSKEIGVIGVGEATTVTVPNHLHDYLGVDIPEFFNVAQPIWKLAIRFLWGKRPYFDYIFGHQFHSKYNVLPRYNGFYTDEHFDDCGLVTAMMSRDRVFARLPNGLPRIDKAFGYHLENVAFVGYLEMLCRRVGVVIEEGIVSNVEQDERGISRLVLQDGRAFTGDLYLDCSGFRSLLMGKTFGEPFISFKSSLFCDRAVVGGWERGANEPIQAFTIAETMNSGWCWRIDHEKHIHRGYVYSSSFISDADADAEFRAKNPRLKNTRKVEYDTGRYERAWVKNVVSIGNAGGFVEPIESTGLSAVCLASQNLAEMLLDCGGQPSPTMTRLFNNRTSKWWDAVRGFLALHYKFNNRLDTPFWVECRQNTDIGCAAPVVEFYQENGPTPIWHPTLLDPIDQFGAEGYLALLAGMQVPYQRRHAIAEVEWITWNKIRQSLAQRAQNAWRPEEVLQLFRSRGFEGINYFT